MSDGTGFTYLMQIRAGAEAQEGYQTLNRCELPSVCFRARFELGDAKLKSHMMSGSGSDPSLPEGD